MNDLSQLMGHSRIIHNHQNYVVWPPPENAVTCYHRPTVIKTNKPENRKENDPIGAPTRDSDSQNRSKGRRRFHGRFAPFAPRNTTSFLIRAKKSGGIASLASPPAILSTPMFSPAREGLVDMVREEWGIDGYGSMKGLIRLREASPKAEGGGAWSESVVEEERVEVERRIDYDLSRFEMIYPNSIGGDDQIEEEGSVVGD